VKVRPLDLSGPDVGQWCAIYAAGHTAEAGSRTDPAVLAARLQDRPDAAQFAAFDDEAHLVGAATVNHDGETEAFARIYVDPAARRAGAGRALATAVSDWAGRNNRSRVKGTIIEGSPGERFASAFGASVVTRLVTVERLLDAAAPPVSPPSDLTLVRWSDRAPEEFLESYTVLRQAVGDAPDAGLQMDVAAVRTGAWVREWERDRTASGNELWVSAAVHDGRLVAFTEVEVPPTGDASQHDTATLPQWRGRGIGTWLKADMIDWIRQDRPAVDRVTSTINARNIAMLAVCARLGFREAWRRQLVVVELR
jgi:GNAT superfamily N-acetyltransferase